jgi:L-aminopeptidase/D-esterase-like protein
VKHDSSADAFDFTPLGIAVGHATDPDGGTGLTVIRGIHGPLRAGVALFGRASGSRELPTASPFHLVEGRADAILLTGGSAYGLDASAGVMRWMEERGRGFDVGVGVVPIVPAAVLFDMAPLGRPDARPTADMAYEACERARSRDVAEGSVGAGTGATVGKFMAVRPDAPGSLLPMKGGFGAALSGDAGVRVAAFAAVNAFGDVRDASGAIIAGARDASGSFVDTQRVLAAAARRDVAFADIAMQNTTLAVVAVGEPLDSVALTQVARAAGAALFARITPTGTSVDGDVVFAVAPYSDTPASSGPMGLETLAAETLGTAIERAVRLARGSGGVPGLADHSS